MKKTKNKTVNVRKQLKIQLENTITRYKNTKGFKPTQEQLYHWFRTLNKGLFNSRLPSVPLRVKKLHKDWGRCVANWDNRKTPKGKFNQRIIPYHIDVEFYIELHCKFPTWRDFVETRYYNAATNPNFDGKEIIKHWIEEIYPHMEKEQQGYLLNYLSCKL